MDAQSQSKNSKITLKVVVESYTMPDVDELQEMIGRALHKAGLRSSITIEPEDPRPMIF